MHPKPRVIVIGGGFSGLWAVRGLSRASAEIFLIDKSNHHNFQPLLYQVATAGLAAPSISAPLRHILRRQRNVTVLMGEAGPINVAARVVTVEGIPYEYDFLVLAAGATHAYFGHDLWARDAPGLKTLDDALAIRGRVLSAFERAEAAQSLEERDAWLRFVIVGGGPTGVELAGTLAEIARHTLRHEFRRIDPTTARVLLVEAGSRVLPAFPSSLSAAALRQLEKLGVDVSLGRPITNVDASGVTIGTEPLLARTVLWAAGVAASPLGAALGGPVDRAGRVVVTPDLSIPEHPEVYVAGDLASVTYGGGSVPVPGIAPAAKQMGRYVARAILDRLAGHQKSQFRYRHYGSLATIGRRAAVVDFGRLRLSGLLAWCFWLSAHIFFLIGFRNRLVVLIDWAEAYWTYRRGARIIVGESKQPRDNPEKITA
jgi:NADH dehydrogenase